MDFFAPDTLVLKINENCIDTGKPDTTVYILYDKATNRYVIRGKRDSFNDASCTYSFDCKIDNDLAEFLDFVLDKRNLFSFILYNYDNLPYTSNEISYEFLKKYDSADYKIGGYDNKKYKRKKVLKLLRMLKNVFNYY